MVVMMRREEKRGEEIVDMMFQKLYNISSEYDFEKATDDDDDGDDNYI